MTSFLWRAGIHSVCLYRSLIRFLLNCQSQFLLDPFKQNTLIPKWPSITDHQLYSMQKAGEKDKPGFSKAWNDSNASLFLPVQEGLNTDSLLSHQVTIGLTSLAVDSLMMVNQCVCVHPCVVWFFFCCKWKSIGPRTHLLAEDMQGWLFLLLSLSPLSYHRPTHTIAVMSDDVRVVSLTHHLTPQCSFGIFSVRMGHTVSQPIYTTPQWMTSTFLK